MLLLRIREKYLNKQMQGLAVLIILNYSLLARSLPALNSIETFPMVFSDTLLIF